MKPFLTILALPRSGLLSALLCVAILAVAGQSAEASSPRIVTIYNFVRNSDYRVPNSEEVLFEATRREIELVKSANLPRLGGLGGGRRRKCLKVNAGVS